MRKRTVDLQNADRLERRMLVPKLGLGDRKYPIAIHLYLQPPFVEISLESFEELAVERLKV